MDLDNINKLQLLDIIGTPSNNLLFSSLNDILIYSIGSTLIFYNLQKNTKTFLQYYYKNEITTLKFLDSKEQLILIIDKSSLLSIWKIPFLEEIYSEEIFQEKNFNFNNIYIEKLYSHLFILIISSIDCNLLYFLKHENFKNFSIERISQIPKVSNEIEGFKCFYDDIYLIFITKNNLLYYLIDINQVQENIKIYQKISFPFKLRKNSLEISNKLNLIFFLTSKGNCLIYNKKGENNNSINPLNKEENFVSINLDDNSLCLGTDSSKIYIYDIDYNSYNFTLKYFIKEQTLNNIKLHFQLNTLDKTNIYNNISIEKINLNQKLDKIFISMNNNSIIYAPFSSLMSDSRGSFFFNSLGNTSCLYSYNHYEAINAIEINNNYNEYETIIYTCSKDCTLIQYNIDFSTNKLSNLFFDLNDIVQNAQNNNKINDIYLTLIKFHPNDNTKLFAGDNKGFLYIFDIKENYFKYKKYYIDDNSLENFAFSKQGNLISIGTLTGKNVIYDINKNCEFCLKLNDNYLNQKEINFRICNYHVITYSYFFKKEKHKDSILFMKNNKKVELSQLLYEKGKLIKKKIILNEFENDILDIKIHTSENYLLVLNNQNKIIINEINLGETSAVIDLSSQINKIYNFHIDLSGLYIFIICSNYSFDSNDLLVLQIGTGEIVTYIKSIGNIYKLIFDYYCKYIIMGSDDGILSLWKIPYQMKQLMINVLSEIEKNENYWEQFEIKYNTNNTNNINNLNEIEMPQKCRTEISRIQSNSEEIEDNGPHKGIQTWQNYNDIKDKKNGGNKNVNSNIKNYNYTFQKDKNSNNKNNIADYITNSYIPNNINNKNELSDKSNTNMNNKMTKLSNNNRNKENNLDKNIKEENTLQNCYEKFKKERLMKNAFIKPNNSNKINKPNKINKINNKSLSSPKISSNKKYFKQPVYNDIICQKEKYNKKENDIDLDIDFNINKIRPNFDPNLYSEQINQKYSSISKELIKPFITERKNKNNYLRNSDYKYDYNNINSNNNNDYPNFTSSNNNNLSFSNKIINKSKSIKQEENKKINEAMNVLMEKTKNKNTETNLSNNINNNINNNKSISSKDISHDYAFINNVRIEPNKLNNQDLSEDFSSKNNFRSYTKTKTFTNTNILSERSDKNNFNKNIETVSSRKKNMVNEKINNFEKRLNYY